MCTKIFVLFTFLLFFSTKSFCKKYDNYTLYRGMPVNEDHLNFFKNLESMYDINFWRPPSTVYRPVEFVVPPENQNIFVFDAKEREIYLTTLIHDVQRAFDKQTVKTYIRRNMESFNWQNYYKVNDIYSWLKDLSKEYPQQMNMFSIGKTYENRHIYAVKILLKGSKRRSTVIVEGGVHAREWISPAFVTYMLFEILNAPNRKNKELLNIAMTYEWYFVPVLNPDGYEYTHVRNGDRLWRKNRDHQHGVDINRNFDVGFGTVGVSHNKNTEIYCGPHAFSEKESLAMANFVKSQSERLEYYMGFHSYGQYMIIPYAHSSKHSDNYSQVKLMGQIAAKNLSRRYGTQYSVGTAYDTVGYKTSGVSGCWVKKTFRVPYVMTFELRDNGEEGFALPPQQIIPTCRETMEGMLSFLTPRTKSYEKLKLKLIDEDDIGHEDDNGPNNQENTKMDAFVVVCNVLIFIIVRFD